MYICEDLVYYLICYNNLGVIKADEFRKNLGIQSVWNKRETIAAIMKIFAKEIMIRQYKINGLPFDVDLSFIVHKLVIENLGFTFIRINPDVENVDLDIEIAKIYNYINASCVRLAVNLAEEIVKEHVKFF